MTRVDGYEANRRALAVLEGEAVSGGGYLATLSTYDRRVLINWILTEIAWFTKPEIAP